MIKLEDKAKRQADAIGLQQRKIEDLTGCGFRLEAHLELLTSAAMIKKLKGDWIIAAANNLPPTPSGRPWLG